MTQKEQKNWSGIRIDCYICIESKGEPKKQKNHRPEASPKSRRIFAQKHSIMSDKLSPEQRHRCMSRIRAKDTKPEMIVRRYLFSKVYRYRLNVKKLPGSPDIVLKKYRTVIFINGCFWHAHEGCRYFVVPKSNPEFWEAKFKRNKERDLEDYDRLHKLGWNVIVIWECQLKPKCREHTLGSIDWSLNKLFLENLSEPRTVSFQVTVKNELAGNTAVPAIANTDAEESEQKSEGKFKGKPERKSEGKSKEKSKGKSKGKSKRKSQ